MISPFAIALCLFLLLAYNHAHYEMPLWEEPSDAPPNVTSTTEHRISTVRYPRLVVIDAVKGVQQKNTAIMVIPGGGYSGLSIASEGFNVAAMLSAQGYHCFILKYRFAKKNTFPIPLQDAIKGIRIIKKLGQSRGFGKVGAIGFSAGGHLLGMLSTLYMHLQFDFTGRAPDIEYDHITPRPDFAVYVYPVVSMGEFTPAGSRASLLGASPNDTLVHTTSVHQQTSAACPTSLIFHSGDDKVVLVENAMLLYRQLQKHRVDVDLHIFAHGGHGWSAGRMQPRNYVITLMDWLANLI